jgi:N-methylhydantoinase B
VGGYDPKRDRSYVMYVISGGGYGGNATGDGISNGCSTIGISKTTPIEVMEQYYPVLFEEYSLHEGSGGAGEARGGFGVNYAIRVLRGDARASMVMDHGRSGPLGALGGDDGGVNTVAIERRGQTYRPQHLSKDQDIELAPGDVIRISTPGGGGYGNPFRRSPDRVASDVARGYYTADDAERLYGVRLAAGGSVDSSATARLRNERAGIRRASRTV